MHQIVIIFMICKTIKHLLHMAETVAKRPRLAPPKTNVAMETFQMRKWSIIEGRAPRAAESLFAATVSLWLAKWAKEEYSIAMLV